MAVSKMKRLSVITLSENADRLIYSLQKLRAVSVTELSPPSSSNDTETDGAVTQNTDNPASLLTPVSCADEIRAVSATLSRTKRAIDFLAAYFTGKKPMFAPLDEYTLEDFERNREGDAAKLLNEAIETEDGIAASKNAVMRANAEIETLAPWREWEYSLPGYSTKYTKTVCGTFFPTADITAVNARLSYADMVLDVIGRDKNGIYAVMTAHIDAFDEAIKQLTASGFVKTSATAGIGDGKSAADMLSDAQARLDAAQAKLDELKAHASELASQQSLLEAYWDVLSSRLSRLEAKEMTAASGMTVMLTGWVPEKAIPKVEKLLSDRCDAYSFEDPSDGDDVPVLLENNRLASQFEPVVGLYSLPAYGTFDPTFIMSIFYIVIFGLMFADVGYGLLVAGLCLFAVLKLPLRGSIRKFCKMFVYCGISSAVMGALFGGWFGDIPVVFMQNFLGISAEQTAGSFFNGLWFSMTSDPITYLIVSLGIGAVHLVTAMLIKFYILAKDGKLLDAIFDVGSWLVLFAGIGLYFVIPSVGLWVAVAGVAMLVLTQGRHEKNIVMKLLKGIMSLYDLISYASDLLSYSRILALGLAGAVIGGVINILCTMGGVTPVGIIIFIVVFPFGHLLNIVINILGAFVHDARLQYIEFFGKFYEDGGKPFEPLQAESKYVILK